jgi:class 3 adenylate cyclase
MNNFYDDMPALERYLNLPSGSLANIPPYALKPAVDAIKKVKAMEANSLFRPGLYYIVLADLCSNTAFNATYGDREGDVRTQWFHTAVIESLGEIQLRNYVAFSKTIGDASLVIFSSIQDVVAWSSKLSENLGALSQEYRERAHEVFADFSEQRIEEAIDAFELRARRLVHLGEVSFQAELDPISLAVSQTFKIEKTFTETHLGCTQAVADAISPKLLELGVNLVENKPVLIAGAKTETMTYYILHD